MTISTILKGATRALLSFVVFFSTSAMAHIRPGVVKEAQNQICQYHFIEGAPADEKAPRRSEIRQSIINQITERTSLMFAEGEPNPVLKRDAYPGADGTMTTDLVMGMDQLFSHEIFSNASDKLHAAMEVLAAKWADARKRFIESEFTRYLTERQRLVREAKESLQPGEGNENLIPKPDPVTGFFQTPYILDHADFLKRILEEEEKANPGTIEAFRAKSLKQQELQLKKYLLDRTASLSTKVSSELKEVKRNHQRSAFEDGKLLNKKLADEYDSGITPNLDVARFHRFLVERFEIYKAALQELFPLPDEFKERADFKKAIELPDNFDQSVVLNGNNEFQVNLPTGQSVGVFHSMLASVGVHLNPPSQSHTAEWNMRTAMIMNFHGCGTNKSTVASFLRLGSVSAKCGYHSVAYNLPGAAGEDGVGLNSIQNYLEMGSYMELLGWHTKTHSLKPDMPIVAFGRSMGSTQTFANLVAAQELGYTPWADVSMMTSYSNPKTLSDQIKNVFAQRDRGDITNVRDDALYHSMWFAKDLQEHLRHLTPENVSLRNRQLQVTFVFVQGKGDEDGIIPGSNVDIGDEVDEYRDEYSPYSPTYIFEDPLAAYKTDGVIKYDEDGEMKTVNSADLEAMHFLVSTREDMTEEEAMKHPFFSKLPPHLWPQRGSQTKEVYGIPWAMLDYLISHCPYTHPVQRERLRKARFEATGSHSPFAYLERYVEMTINPKIPEGQRKTLQEIVADDSILPSRESGIYGRMKKLQQWVLKEAKRVSELAPIPAEEASTPIVRMWELAPEASATEAAAAP